MIRDVAITNVTTERTWAYTGWLVPIVVFVKNEGNVHETFTIQVYYDSNLLADMAIVNLLPDEERTVLIQWNTTNVTPYRNYTLCAVAPSIPYEYDTIDNQFICGIFEMRLFGDVNGDGYVGIDDIYTVAHAFGSYLGHTRWNEYADLNQDEYIGIDDLFSVARHFGTESP
jgi:hypothetical protein